MSRQAGKAKEALNTQMWRLAYVIPVSNQVHFLPNIMVWGTHALLSRLEMQAPRSRGLVSAQHVTISKASLMPIK